MECDCSCEWDDGEQPSVHTVKMVRARKTHICCECYGTINPGDEYEIARGCWDGHWDTFHTCLFCSRIRTAWCSHGYIYGQLRSTIWDCQGIDIETGEMLDDPVDDKETQ